MLTWLESTHSMYLFSPQAFLDYYLAVVKPVRIEFKFNPATLVNINHRFFYKLVLSPGVTYSNEIKS